MTIGSKAAQEINPFLSKQVEVEVRIERAIIKPLNHKLLRQLSCIGLDHQIFVADRNIDNLWAQRHWKQNQI